MIYIDFDGVILDTAPILFEEWERLPNYEQLPESEKIKYIQRSNWEKVLNSSRIINDSVYYLKSMNPKESFILTKIHSLENEGEAKIKWIRSHQIKQGIYLVPYHQYKTDIVDPEENILIDDCLMNLDRWKEKKGNPILFDINNDNYDSWGEPNIKGYQKVLNLSSFIKAKKD